ncbi:MAG: tetratricopeptide repeat protein [Rickettsiales bacterium]|nr:tetratricopeptide repeat protein [Rickettsiales bacterium]
METEIELTQTLAEQGNAEAQYKFGIYLLLKRHIPNIEVTYQLAEKYGQTVLGSRATENEIAQARLLFRLSAEQGNPKSQYELGFMHLIGNGANEDPVEAARLFRLSAEQGNTKAKCELANMYFRGIGVKQDLQLATRLLKEASAQNNDEAQFELGTKYIEGNIVRQDVRLGVHLLRLVQERQAKMTNIASSELENFKTK